MAKIKTLEKHLKKLGLLINHYEGKNPLKPDIIYAFNEAKFINYKEIDQYGFIKIPLYKVKGDELHYIKRFIGEIIIKDIRPISEECLDIINNYKKELITLIQDNPTEQGDIKLLMWDIIDGLSYASSKKNNYKMLNNLAALTDIIDNPTNVNKDFQIVIDMTEKIRDCLNEVINSIEIEIKPKSTVDQNEKKNKSI